MTAEPTMNAAAKPVTDNAARKKPNKALTCP